MMNIRQTDWSDAARTGLAKAMGDDVDWLGVSVKRGDALLYEVMDGSDRVGFYALRAERIGERIEGVIIAVEGSWSKGPLIETVWPVIKDQFKACDVIRVLTKRQGLAKRLESMGWIRKEIVLEIKNNV